MHAYLGLGRHPRWARLRWSQWRLRHERDTEEQSEENPQTSSSTRPVTMTPTKKHLRTWNADIFLLFLWINQHLRTVWQKKSEVTSTHFHDNFFVHMDILYRHKYTNIYIHTLQLALIYCWFSLIIQRYFKKIDTVFLLLDSQCTCEIQEAAVVAVKETFLINWVAFCH